MGRCPGALADALQRLAEGVSGARLAFVKDLRTRLLTLFTGAGCDRLLCWMAAQFTLIGWLPSLQSGLQDGLHTYPHPRP